MSDAVAICNILSFFNTLFVGLFAMNVVNFLFSSRNTDAMCSFVTGLFTSRLRTASSKYLKKKRNLSVLVSIYIYLL